MDMKKRGNEETVRSGAISSFPHFLIPLAVAAFLRLQGLAWGLPGARHWFSYHPDESLVLRAATNVNLFSGHLDPGFYNYGSFLIYCISLVSQVIDAWSPLRTMPNEMARLTLIGRWEVALFGIATVYAVYLIGNRIAGRRAGLWASAVMAVIPMHVMHSHYVTVDVPVTFWVSVALYNALRYPDARRSALLCGLAAGIAAGTKYNAGLVLLAGWAAIWLNRDAPRAGRWKAFGVMTGATAMGFLLTTPGVLLATPAFLRDFSYETLHVRTGHGLVFIDTGNGWWFHIATNLWQGIGAFLPLAAVVALGSLAVSPRRRVAASASPPLHVSSSLILAAFALPYFALIGAAAVRFQRYDMPLLPILAVLAGCLFAKLSGRWLVMPCAALLGTFVLSQGAVSTMAYPFGDIHGGGYKFEEDPRDAVADYLEHGIPAGTSIGLTREPWFFSPPVSVANGGPQTAALFERVRRDQPHPLVILPPDADAFHPAPDFVVISDYEFGDAIRLQGARVPESIAHIGPVAINPNSPPEAQRITRLWNSLVRDYAIVGVWSPRQRCMGLSWPKRTLPPHDSFYSYPTLFVFHYTGPGNR